MNAVLFFKFIIQIDKQVLLITLSTYFTLHYTVQFLFLLFQRDINLVDYERTIAFVTGQDNQNETL